MNHKHLPFGGVRIIESRFLTEPGAPIEVRRPWQERLFMRPWHPWQQTRTIIPQVPYCGGYRLSCVNCTMAYRGSMTDEPA